MKHFLTLAALLTAGAVQAQDISGIWQTQRGDEGNFAHVKIEPCGNQVCGTIYATFDGNNQRTESAAVGERIIWDMTGDGAGSWSGGKIWAPDNDKTYSSKMSLQGADLKVSGCVAGILCRSQIWRKVQ